MSLTHLHSSHAGHGDTAQASYSNKSLGEMLIEANLLTQKQLEHASETQRDQGKKITEVLIEQGFVSAEDLTAVLSIQMNIPFIDLKHHTIQPEALDLIPEWMARKHNLIPLDIVADSLVVVMANPADIQSINDLVAQSGRKIQPAIAIPSDIREAIDLNYKAVHEIEQEIETIKLAESKAQQPVNSKLTIDAAKRTPLAKTVDLLVHQGIRQRASDIHFEPQRDRLRVRYRIDGVLQEVMGLPLSIHASVISRIKILADMNIAERRLPQDGQMTLALDGREIDIRIATSETAHGEMMVLRILDKARFLFDLADLGFMPEDLETYRRMLNIPFGLILIAGPTGSGKTTTLYASVNQIDRAGRNIITVEEPIEYLFTDINQIQVNPKAGITFATGLKAIMRLDPDVILIGEMRDSDTANTGIQAALTGHLVLSSIHGNDTSGVLARLANLGVEPFLSASALIGIVAQRMVRRICPHCRTTYEPSKEEKLAYEATLGEPARTMYCGSGCNFCTNTGFLGRTGVFEIMPMSEQIRDMHMTNTPAQAIRDQALRDGMAPMLRDGMVKVKAGITTPGEVLRSVHSLA